jgi:hypothetical protein
MLGGFLGLSAQLVGIGDSEPATIKLRWHRRGLRDFDASARNGADIRGESAGDGLRSQKTDGDKTVRADRSDTASPPPNRSDLRGVMGDSVFASARRTLGWQGR